jgi:hypothetical protein
MNFNILCYAYSQHSRQRVSVGIPAIFRVIFLLQEHSYGNNCVITPQHLKLYNFV